MIVSENWVLVVGVHMMRALLFEVYIRPLTHMDFWPALGTVLKKKCPASTAECRNTPCMKQFCDSHLHLNVVLQSF